MAGANAILQIERSEDSGFRYIYSMSLSADMPYVVSMTTLSHIQPRANNYLLWFNGLQNLRMRLKDEIGLEPFGYLSNPNPPYILNLRFVSSSDDEVYITVPFNVTSVSRVVVDNVPYLDVNGTVSQSNPPIRSPGLTALGTSFGDSIFFNGRMFFERADVTEASRFQVWADIEADTGTVAFLDLDVPDRLQAGYEATVLVRFDRRIRPRMYATYEGIRYTIAQVEIVAINRVMRLTLRYTEA